MRLEPQQYAVLDAMGIPVWQLRQSTSQQQISVEPHNTERLAIAPEQFVVCCQAFKHNSPEHYLLTAILKALAINGEQVYFADQQQVHQLSGIPNRVLMFADDMKQVMNNGIVVPSLSAILHNPLLKQSVWQALKIWLR